MLRHGWPYGNIRLPRRDANNPASNMQTLAVIKRVNGQWSGTMDGRSVVSKDMGAVFAFLAGPEVYSEYLSQQERIRRAHGPRAVLGAYMYA